MADVYVDFSAANDGDGTAPAQAAGAGLTGAYKTLVSKTFASGDLVWIRRSTTLTITSQLTLSQGGAIYIGWPESGDPYYATRTAAGQVLWDGDASGYAIITATTNFATFVSVATNANQEFNKIKFFCNYTGTSAMDCLSVSIAASFISCWVEHAGTAASATIQSAIFKGAAVTSFKNSTIRFSGASTSTGTFVVRGTGSGYGEFINCTISATSASNNISVIGEMQELYFIDCTISNSSTSATATVVFPGNGSAYWLYNCTIDSDSTAQQFLITFNNSAGAIAAHRLTVNKGCKISAHPNGQLHFSRFNQTVASNSFGILEPNGGHTFTGSNISFVAGNTSGDIQISTGGYRAFRNVVFGNKTFPFGPTFPLPGNAPNSTSGGNFLDYEGTAGAFKYIGQHGKVENSPVFRTGGESFSLKFEIRYATNTWNHLVPYFPGTEKIFVTLPASLSTVTIYGTTLGVQQHPLKEEIWFNFDYYNGGTANRAMATSRVLGLSTLVASDASTWSDANLMSSTFKLEVTVTPGQISHCPISLFYAPNKPGGTIFIDPKPVVT